MKNKAYLILIVAFSTFQNGINAQQIESEEVPNNVEKNHLDFTITGTTNYIWRDVVSNYPAIQPSTTYIFSSTGVRLNVWSSFGANFDTNDLEISLTLSYDFNLSNHFDSSLGIVYYYAPAIVDIINTNFGEVYFNASLADVFLQPSFTVFVNENASFYSTLALEKQLYHWKSMAISIDSSLGYQFNNKNRNNGLRNVNFGLSLSRDFKNISMALFTSATQLIESNTTHLQGGIQLNLK